VDADEAPPPWEQLDGESSAAYERFRRYRDAGPRRSVRVAGDVPRGRPASGYVRRLAERWRWRERAHAWDLEVHRRRDRARLDAAASVDDVQRAVDAAFAALLSQAGIELDRADLHEAVDVEPADRWDALAAEVQADVDEQFRNDRLSERL
jgi:hypothetical protein